MNIALLKEGDGTIQVRLLPTKASDMNKAETHLRKEDKMDGLKLLAVRQINAEETELTQFDDTAPGFQAICRSVIGLYMDYSRGTVSFL